MKNTQSHCNATMTAALRAVQKCRLKPLGDPQRIIVLLTPAGASLSSFWRKELGCRGGLVMEAGHLDTARLKHLKMLANRTRVVPVLLVEAEFWRNWNRRRSLESAQIRRRIHLVIELDEN